MTPKRSKLQGLSRLKKIIGKRGDKFAALVGIPVNTLKSIESGRLALSTDNANKIHRATGVDANSLSQKQPTEIRRKGEEPTPYTEQFFYRWRTTQFEPSQDVDEARRDAEVLGESLGNWCKILLLAGVERGTPYRGLHLEIAQFLNVLVQKHGLGRPGTKTGGIACLDYVLHRRGHEKSLVKKTGVQWREIGRKYPTILPDFGLTRGDVRKMAHYETYERERTQKRNFIPDLKFTDWQSPAPAPKTQ